MPRVNKQKKIMKFFVSSNWSEKPLVADLQSWLQSKGHEITLGWTNFPDTLEGTPQETYLQNNAVLDIAGVQDCDILISLFTKEYVYRGTYCEMGAALALGKDVYLVGKYADACIFSYHPLVTKLEDMWTLMRKVESLHGKN